MATLYPLGAIQSPPDERDYPIADLFAAFSVPPRPEAVLPAGWYVPLMPPVYSQDGPKCVPFHLKTLKAYQDHLDQGPTWYDFDTARFFTDIGGGPDGAIVRVALDRLLKVGYPTVGHSDASKHRIAAYYAVPKVRLAIKQAIHAFGPLSIALPWFDSWFSPHSNGVLPRPTHVHSGHAIVLYGWNDTLGWKGEPTGGWLLRNSWGADWGDRGHCLLPYAYDGAIWEVWKTIDVIER